MAYPAATARMTCAEYLAAEAVSEIRHEFLNGEVWAMSGGTPEHSALAAAVIGDLRNVLRGKPCRVFTSDLRVRVVATGLSTYPDVSVVCEKIETALEDPHALTNPIVLVEVLSDTTEAQQSVVPVTASTETGDAPGSQGATTEHIGQYVREEQRSEAGCSAVSNAGVTGTTGCLDRGAKFAHYRRIPSLRAYVLVSQVEPRIEVYRRADAGHWELTEARAGERAEIAPLAVGLDVSAIYANPLEG